MQSEIENTDSLFTASASTSLSAFFSLLAAEAAAPATTTAPMPRAPMSNCRRVMERLSPAGREMLIRASGAWDAAVGRPVPMPILGPGVKVAEPRLCFTVPCAPRPALPRTVEAPWRGTLVAWLRTDGRAVAPRDVPGCARILGMRTPAALRSAACGMSRCLVSLGHRGLLCRFASKWPTVAPESLQ